MTPQNDPGPSGDGYAVDFGALLEIGRTLAADVNAVHIPKSHDLQIYTIAPHDWHGVHDVEKFILDHAEGLYDVTSDALVECMVAASGIATAGANYDIAEDSSWLIQESVWNRKDTPADQRSNNGPGSGLSPRSSWSSQTDGYRVTSDYPRGDFTVTYNKLAIAYDYQEFSREEIRDLLMQSNEQPLLTLASQNTAIADDLDMVVNGLKSAEKRTVDVWGGTAGEGARQALQKIHTAVLRLADAHRTLSAVAGMCGENVLMPAKNRFDHVVPTENRVTDIFQDDDDVAARDYLKNVDQRFVAELAPLKQNTTVELPGLIQQGDRVTYHHRVQS
jgi:hypothetical protein